MYGGVDLFEENNQVCGPGDRGHFLIIFQVTLDDNVTMQNCMIYQTKQLEMEVSHRW